LSTQRNSFHRINVTRQIYYHNNGNSDNTQRSQTLAAIVIDSDVDTPVFRWWDGSISDIRWLKEYMDYMRYEILKPTKSNKTLVAVELNPLIVSAVKGLVITQLW
jgi:hypothetical protein